MKHGGEWVTSPDGQSMTRRDNSGKTVMKADGTPFTIPYSAIDMRQEAYIRQASKDLPGVLNAGQPQSATKPMTQDPNNVTGD
jgi:hypothetical protein